MFVGRIGAANAGFLSLTSGGTLNTGSAVFWDPAAGGTAYARRHAGAGAVEDATKLQAGSTPVVVLATLTATGASLYVNSNTPASVATVANSFSVTTCTLGALATALTYCMNGTTCAEAAVWSRVLSSSEIALALRTAGAYYGIAIA
jgi:hypothetical protein